MSTLPEPSRRWAPVLALVIGVSAVCASTGLAAAETPPRLAELTPPAAPQTLTAQQIVDKSIAARGGLETWDKIRSLAWIGHIESDRLGDQQVKFSLEEVRPNKSRFDIVSSHPSQRIFNGKKGWNVHQKEDGMPDVVPFTPLEERFALDAPGLGGPLISFRSQNREVALLGHDGIEGRDCYRLGVKVPSGGVQLVWVDAETFLETRFDRPSYGRDGKPGMVTVYFRDYKSQGGLQVPTVLEIGGGPDRKPDRLVIERVAINPEIEESRFAKPATPPHKHEFTLQPTMPGAPGTSPR